MPSSVGAPQGNFLSGLDIGTPQAHLPYTFFTIVNFRSSVREIATTGLSDRNPKSELMLHRCEKPGRKPSRAIFLLIQIVSGKKSSAISRAALLPGQITQLRMELN